MVLIAIGLLILSFSFFDFKNAYYAFICYIIFWTPQAFCFTIGDKDVIINMIMSLGLFASFLINYKKVNTTKRLMPFTVPFLFIFFSMILTCCFAKGGFRSEFFRFASKILQTYTTIFISWYVFETKEDFQKLIKVIIISFFIAGVYGIVESIIQANPYVDYKRDISTDMLSTYKTMSRGYRIISVFEHPIGAGLNFGIVCALILYLYLYDIITLPFKKFSILTCILCFICVILTKQRGNYLFLLVALIPCLNPKKINISEVVLFTVIIFTMTLPFTYNRMNIVTSLFDDDAQSQIKGSTIQMRLDQLNAIKEIISDSPVFGLGEKYANYISPEIKERIMGTESVWLESLVKHGAVGVLSNAVLAIYSVAVIPYKFKSNKLFFLALAYWITYTFTTFLGFRFDLYYCILFYYIKTSDIYIKSPNKMMIVLK